MPKILHGDCLEVLKGMETGSVDLVFCSPPYEDARLYGELQYKVKGQEWVDWCIPRFEECLRVSKGLVAWVIEGKTKNFQWTATPALLMADLHRRGVKLRKPPIYHRVGIPGSGGPEWLRNDYEFIVCASHGRLPWADNTAMGHPPKWAPGGEMSHRLTDGTRRNQWGSSVKGKSSRARRTDGTMEDAAPRPSHITVTTADFDYLPPVKANPGNVIRCSVGGGHLGSKLAHMNEAPFPESLAEFFIRSFCPPGGIVLDPFSGSGTTVAVALKTGREGIGVDIRQSQIDLTTRRIQEVQTNA